MCAETGNEYPVCGAIREITWNPQGRSPVDWVSTVTLSGAGASVGSLQLGGGNGITVSNGSLSVSGSQLIHAGTIELNGSGGTNFLNIAGNVTLNGGDAVNLINTSLDASIISGNNTLTDAGNTIQGTGVIGNGSSLTLVNGSTIDANTSTGISTLTLNGGGGLTNTETFAASNGGTLTATVPFTNTGLVHAISGTTSANQGFTGTAGTAQILFGGDIDDRRQQPGRDIDPQRQRRRQPQSRQ